MIMMGNRKPLIAAILGKKDDEQSPDAALDTLHACAEELIDAVHAKDVAGVVSAIQAMVEECTAAPVEGPQYDDGE